MDSNQHHPHRDHPDQHIPYNYKDPSESVLFKRIIRTLNTRKSDGSLRSLVPHLKSEQPGDGKVDFSSNDYLGLAYCHNQHNKVNDRFQRYIQLSIQSSRNRPLIGATGSRLLSGNTTLPRIIEEKLADIHNRECALICNSGYDANLNFLSSVPVKGDVMIMDELVHNSIVMGIRMSRLDTNDIYTFQHNNMADLARILEVVKHRQYLKSIFVAVESVYSMDGDISPLDEILNLSLRFEAFVIVDEAHGLGVYGKTNIDKMDLPEQNNLHKSQNKTSPILGGTGVLAALGLERHPALLASVYTFGKAAGCHGAVIASSRTMIEYLVNYARPFIYSTALPPHSLLSIQCAYETMLSSNGEERRHKVFHLVRLFRVRVLEGLKKNSLSTSLLLPSPSPIQALMCRGNKLCIEFAHQLRQDGFDVYPIRSPTVPKNSERIRIILHYHNSERDINRFVASIIEIFKGFQICNSVSSTQPRSRL